jgi:hypothetical protein
MTPDMVEAVAADQSLAELMVAPLKERLLVAGLISLDAQLANIRRWNIERGYGFSSDELSAVDITPGGEQSLRRVDLLVPVSKDMAWAFDDLWGIASSQQADNWRNPDLKTDAAHLRVHPKATVYERGIHRVTLDLVAHHEPEDGRTVTEVREAATQSGETLAALEVLAAAAHFPEWVQAMDGEKVPYVDLAGYEYRLNDSDESDEAWSDCPFLHWWADSRELRLHLSVVGFRPRRYSAPVRREL